ncbi:ABC transporter substrate-binding protein [uncultured Desulfosarcina sp.]|uniref:ABC transporter substrate-binding protein n=1 Tax=uncultured Desulfosarcina sp. TaxID=218289 RepID=UPI0029C977BB|nr:ABC transporter substrate-binding protein [uncultured Desulfosarcina sp.]
MKRLMWTVGLLAFVSVFLVISPIRQAGASPAPVPRQMDVIMIGDRLVDVSHSLGVVPAAMSVRCSIWPLCKPLQSAVQVLGCPNCLIKKKADPLLQFAQKHNTKRVIIEKSDPFCIYVPKLQLEKIATFLEGKGFEIAYVDFTQGLGGAVRQTAALLGCTEKVDEVLAEYATTMEKTRKKMAGQQFAKSVVILRGTYQSTTGKTFLRIEAPGGYADRFLLKPMGIENVGGKMIAVGEKPSKGHVGIRKLDGLIAAAPDAIVMTGDAIAVQKAMAEAIHKNPGLGDVPAIKAHAIYSLPGYIDSSVIEYPLILRRWADALCRK